MPLVGPAEAGEDAAEGPTGGCAAALLAVLSSDSEPWRRDWIERDRAVILTAPLAGPRGRDELVRANVVTSDAPTTGPTSTSTP